MPPSNRFLLLYGSRCTPSYNKRGLIYKCVEKASWEDVTKTLKYCCFSPNTQFSLAFPIILIFETIAIFS